MKPKSKPSVTSVDEPDTQPQQTIFETPSTESTPVNMPTTTAPVDVASDSPVIESEPAPFVTRVTTDESGITNILVTDRVEYFDDRFYTLKTSDKIHPSYIANIPETYIDRTGEGDIEIFLPSVTTIQNIESKPFLATWRGDVGNERANQILQQSQIKGGNIHRAIELMTTGHTIVFQNLKTQNITDIELEEMKKTTMVHVVHEQTEMIQIARCRQLMDTLNVTVHESELNVFNLSGCYAGTTDGIWHIPSGEYDITGKPEHIDGGYYVIDFKTGKSFDESSVLEQLSAYYHALNEMHMASGIVGVIGIYLNADKKRGIAGVKCAIRTIDQIQQYWTAFQIQRDLFLYRNNVIPKRFTFPAVIEPYAKTTQIIPDIETPANAQLMDSTPDGATVQPLDVATVQKPDVQQSSVLLRLSELKSGQMFVFNIEISKIRRLHVPSHLLNGAVFVFDRCKEIRRDKRLLSAGYVKQYEFYKQTDNGTNQKIRRTKTNFYVNLVEPEMLPSINQPTIDEPIDEPPVQHLFDTNDDGTWKYSPHTIMLIDATGTGKRHMKLHGFRIEILRYAKYKRGCVCYFRDTATGKKKSTRLNYVVSTTAIMVNNTNNSQTKTN